MGVHGFDSRRVEKLQRRGCSGAHRGIKQALECVNYIFSGKFLAVVEFHTATKFEGPGFRVGARLPTFYQNWNGLKFCIELNERLIETGEVRHILVRRVVDWVHRQLLA